MKIKTLHSILSIICLVMLPMFTIGCAQHTNVQTLDNIGEEARWRIVLHEGLPALGHRNWIVVADAAYPSQASPGIETMVTHGDQIEVLRAVLAEIDQAKHLSAHVITDTELKYVDDRDARGVDDYRTRLKNLLDGRNNSSMLHEDLIAKLDKAGEKYHVLILKTNLMIPYTSVFIDLGCGYWPSESEAKLRRAMQGNQDAGK